MRTCHFTFNRKQKRAFYLAIVGSIFEHCSILWHPVSSNQIAPLDAIQKCAIKWILGKKFDHYTDDEYVHKQKELNILPSSWNFTWMTWFCFIRLYTLYKLVTINLPIEFEFVNGNKLIIIHEKDKLRLNAR